MQWCSYWFQFDRILHNNDSNNSNGNNNRKLFRFCSANITRCWTIERVTLCFCWSFRSLKAIPFGRNGLYRCFFILFCGGECIRKWRHCAIEQPCHSRILCSRFAHKRRHNIINFPWPDMNFKNKL